MNVLPIPALDGGHVMFLFYEIIVGRKPNDKFMEYAQMVGMILLLSLLLFVNFNDILRLVQITFFTLITLIFLRKYAKNISDNYTWQLSSNTNINKVYYSTTPAISQQKVLT
jgi:Zn-dependent protease